MDDDDGFCMHELVRAQCSTCNGSQVAQRGRGAGGGTRLADRTEVMHLLVKWSPDRETDTLDRHRAVALAHGTTWWGCETSDPRRLAAKDRVDLLERQLAAGVEVEVYLYRLGDPAGEAKVHRARLVGVAADESGIDVGRRPDGYGGSHCSLYLELADFEETTPSQVLGLELYDPPRGRTVDAGALGNQTSPMYVLHRAQST